MITFRSEDIEMPAIDKQKVSLWLNYVAKSHNRTIGRLNYIFCSDECEIDVNRRFLGHDYYTDVITFDYSSADTLSGDIFISLETVYSNALEVGTTKEQELLRIIVHGLLHLTGQGDKTPETKQQMTEKENSALEIWEKIKNI